MISKNEIRARARAFAKEWEKETYEDGEAKSFWDGFFTVFGVSRRRVATFEYSVKKEDGRQGFVDVLWKGVMLAEHKSLGKDLDKAFTQAKEYFPGLKDAELPRYIVVSDFARMRVHDLETGAEQEFALEDLYGHVDLFGFISGYEVRQYEAEEEASIKAAELMAAFHNEIAKTGYSGHELEVFLVRVLFCLFADDTEIFPKNHFRTYISNRTSEDGSDLGRTLLELFDVLNTPEGKRQTNLDEDLATFPYINGAIFAERISSISLDTAARNMLLKCCNFDWSGISAAIFGSLFQGVMDEKQRRELGAHYTSEINIMKVIQPLFLDELYNEFDASKRSPKKLEEFHNKLATLTFLDPACGCGNFLVTTYRELRRLELEVLKKRRKSSVNTLTAFGAEEFSKLHVNQFYGIEIEEFPALVARTAMYLADHQMNRELSKEFGLAYARIPLEEPATIVHGNALTIDWASVVSPEQLSYIIGNPPFVGHQWRTKEQADAMTTIWGNEGSFRRLDFVTCWFKKAVEIMQMNPRIETALVSTNSIAQGEQVAPLWKTLFEEGVKINFAHQTFKWQNDAKGKAAVHCVITGFALFDKPSKWIYSYKDISSDPKEHHAKNINGYLTDAPNVFITSRSKTPKEKPELIKGSQPTDGGHLLFTEDEKNDFLRQEPLAEQYMRQFMGSYEFINDVKRYCLWLKDISPSKLKAMPLVLNRLEKVSDVRQNSPTQSVREFAKYPSLFTQDRQPDTDYLVIPRVSSERRIYIPIGYVKKDIIASDSVCIISEPNLFLFGLLNSVMHMVWTRTTAGRLKSDYRYTSAIYNSFPHPASVHEMKEKIETCAQAILDTRAEFPTSSLADLYDPRTMPPTLAKAHTVLDRAVDAAYAYKDTGSDADRIAFLFGLYEQITKKV